MPRAKYEAESGDVHSMRLSAAKIALGGAEPTGAVDDNVVAKVSKSNREFGLRPRYVIIARVAGTAPDTFTKYANIPVLTQAAWNSAAFAIGVEISYAGFTWEITARCPEDY